MHSQKLRSRFAEVSLHLAVVKRRQRRTVYSKHERFKVLRHGTKIATRIQNPLLQSRCVDDLGEWIYILKKDLPQLKDMNRVRMKPGKVNLGHRGKEKRTCIQTKIFVLWSLLVRNI